MEIHPIAPPSAATVEHRKFLAVFPRLASSSKVATGPPERASHPGNETNSHDPHQVLDCVHILKWLVTKFYEGECKWPGLQTFGPSGGREGLTAFLSSRAMGDRSVSNPPGICWAAYSDEALLQSIKTIVSELQARAVARSFTGPLASDTAPLAVTDSSGRGGERPRSQDEKAVEKPVQEWY